MLGNDGVALGRRADNFDSPLDDNRHPASGISLFEEDLPGFGPPPPAIGSETLDLRRIKRRKHLVGLVPGIGHVYSCSTVSVRLEFDLVNVTPAPILAGFEGLDDGVVAGMEVLGRVFIPGRVAAADVSAGQAESKVYPGVPRFKAVFAATRAGADIVNLTKVFTLRHCSFSSRLTHYDC
jgi:hypothetical protein